MLLRDTHGKMALLVKNTGSQALLLPVAAGALAIQRVAKRELAAWQVVTDYPLERALEHFERMAQERGGSTGALAALAECRAKRMAEQGALNFGEPSR